MGMRRILGSAGLSLLVASGFAAAKDVALVIGNENYRNFSEVPSGRLVISTVSAFEEAGYEVVQAADATMAQTKDALDQFERLHGDADRVVVVLSGQFMQSGGATWFAPTDLRSPSLANLGFDALPIPALMGFLAEKPGGGALFLAQDAGGTTIDATIRKGIAESDVPQGVLMATGAPSAIRTALVDAFLQPDMSLAAATKSAEDIMVSGFVSDLVSLNPMSSVGDGGVGSAVNTSALSEGMAEHAYWRAVDDMGNKAAYEGYLRKYPDGEFVEQANERLQVIADALPKFTPEEQAERDLALTRNDRRRIQEQLSLLGYDPRGIDGLFGPGSRAAIKRWQAQNGVQASGFMDTQSLRRLRVQAERRAQAMAEEARRQKEKRDAADAELWGRTGAQGSEADYRAYLSKFPKGLYSDVARVELQQIENAKRETALAAETEAWDNARGIDSVEGYEVFLGAYPDGSFADAAQARIADLTEADRDQEMQLRAQAEEQRLGIGGPMRLLIEGKLAALKLKTGRIDGQFDESTRRSVRAYQKARGLPVTGYLSRDTVVRLMSE